MRTLYNILALLMLCCGAVACAVMDDNPLPSYEKTTIVRVGDMAPDFTVRTLAGNDVSLSDYQGKTLLLVFFSSGCKDCHAQLDVLDAVAARFADKNFDILAVSRGEDRQTTEQFVTSRGYGFTVALDPEKLAYNLYATQYVPRCFVIDPLGHILALSVEYNEEEFALLTEIIEDNTSDKE